MKKPVFGLLFILILLLLLSACSPAIRLKTVNARPQAKPTPKTIAVNEAHNGRSGKLGVGDTLVVALPTNPGTGFSWQVVSRSKGVLANLGSTTKAKAGKSVRLGTRERKRFFFGAIKPGNTRLRLV